MSDWHALKAEDSSQVDPILVFDEWFAEAQQSEPNDPNAVALATCTPDGRPSVRMVLAKRVGEQRFAFFTNAGSQKGGQLEQNPRAGLCFHWKSLRRQVRVEGSVALLDAVEADRYFHSRSRASQIGAAVSRQSRPLRSREELERQVEGFADAHPGEVPRPDFWKGYFVVPGRIEFWIDGAHRLHDRFLFTRAGEGWDVERLYP